MAAAMAHLDEARLLRIVTVVCLTVALLFAAVGALRAADVHVQVTTGCETVDGAELCGDALAKYREFERALRATVGGDR